MDRIAFPDTATSAPGRIDSFSIPNDPVFTGAHLYSQGLAIVPGINALGAVTSNGVDLAVGRM